MLTIQMIQQNLFKRAQKEKYALEVSNLQKDTSKNKKKLLLCSSCVCGQPQKIKNIMIYHTGDFGRLNTKTGLYEYNGCFDHQVKEAQSNYVQSNLLI